jgi:hypothetical protein
LWSLGVFRVRKKRDRLKEKWILKNWREKERGLLIVKLHV